MFGGDAVSSLSRVVSCTLALETGTMLLIRDVLKGAVVAFCAEIVLHGEMLVQRLARRTVDAEVSVLRFVNESTWASIALLWMILIVLVDAKNLGLFVYSSRLDPSVRALCV